MLTSGTARKRRAVRILFSAVALGCSYFSQDAFAADGTWSATSGGTWSDVSNWIGGQVPSNSSSSAYFSSNNSSQAISVNSSTTIKSLNFNSSATGVLTLGGSSTLNFDAASNSAVTLFVDSNSADHVINTPVKLQGSDQQLWQISGSRTLTHAGTISGNTPTRGFTKTGAGTLILNGNNTFTGSLGLGGGTVVLNYAASNTPKIGSGGGLFLGEGTLSVVGNNSAATSSVFSGATVGSGASSIRVAAGTGQTATLTLGPLTRITRGGVVDLSLSGSATITTTNLPSNPVAGYLTVGQNNWAKLTSISGSSPATAWISAFSAYDVNDSISSWATGQNITDSTGFSGTVNSLSINTLRFNAAADSTVNIAAANTLSISSSGLMVTSNVGNKTSTIQGGALVGDNGFDLIVHQHNTSGSLVISSQITNSGGGGGAVGLTKTGGGALVLQGSNSYTGANFVHAGTLRAEHANAIGTGAVNIGAATLDLAAIVIGSNATFGNGATLRGSGVSGYSQISGSNPNVAAGAAVTFTAPTASDTLTLGSALRGGSGGTVTVSGSGTVALASGSSAATAFSGAWSINMGSTGVLKLTDGDALGGNTSALATVRILGGTMASNTSGTIPNPITLAGGALGAIATSRTFGGTITLQSSTTSNITSTEPNNASPRGITLAGPIGGSGNLNITGSGNATFTANSNYTGTTTIAGGTLSLVHASSTNNIASSPSITIQSGANLDVSGIASGFALGANQTLKGSGTVHGNFSANPSSASRIAPGNSGKLTFNGDLTLNPNATYDIQIGGDGVGIGLAGTDFDQIVVNGAGKSLTLGTASLKILPMPGIVVGQAYRIVNTTNGAGVVNSSIFKNLTQNLNAGGPYTEGNVTYDIAYGYGSGGYVDITFSAVPEPTSTLLTTLCGALFMRRRRSR